jgi:NAD(P)-dependent dehydrogenase (short-subunit alcohol dehydrogenase family)
MHSVTLDPLLLGNLSGKTAVVTGAAGGIGVEIVRLFVSNGANVAVADLAHARDAAESLIASLSEPSRAVFIPTNILDWSQITTLFRETKGRFGSIEVVIANAGVMEGEEVVDLNNVGEDGELLEAREYSRVIDINLKGTMSSKYRVFCTVCFVFHHLSLL